MASDERVWLAIELRRAVIARRGAKKKIGFMRKIKRGDKPGSQGEA